MKNVIFTLALLVSFTISALAQTATSTAGGSTECEVDCLFTSCKIKCTHQHGGAVCTCAWGFASCACGGANPSVSATATQLSKIDGLVNVLAGYNSGSAKAVVGELNALKGSLGSGDSATSRSRIDNVVNYMKSLGYEERAAVNKYFERNYVDERL